MRYVDSLNLSEIIECFILIEPGKGYLVSALREKFKNSKIIVLHVDKSFEDDSFSQPGISVLHGTGAMSVQDFLERETPDIDASRIRIIEWRPSQNFYREAYVKLLSMTVEFIKRTDAGIKTVSAFGRRWIKNFFKNLDNVQQVLLYKSMEMPVIVTGSGPSLENALSVIRQMQENSLIIASSSSIMALAHGGVSADIIIAADGGSWALQHLYPYFRKDSRDTIIAANFCAALPSQCGIVPRLIINDGSFWQSIILHELALPSVIISQKGTVTAAAAELAMLLSGGNIYLAGMDFSVNDIRTHARPYAFDRLIHDNAVRTSPAYSKSFLRSGIIREGGDYGIYAAWFKNKLASWPKRIFSLNASNKIFEEAPSVPLPEQASEFVKKNISGYFKTINVNDHGAFRKKGAAALCAAIKDIRYSQKLRAELILMLFPGEHYVTNENLQEAIRGVSHG
ncbi:MAG: DUF115 domain-containing protein [Treponema sp.]|nr:DUF115 domain-containing protein [Treponema sp.]